MAAPSSSSSAPGFVPPPLDRRGSLPGGGLVQPEWEDIADPSELAATQDKYWAWAGNLARKLQARALEPPEEHPTAEVETVAGGVNRLEGCLFVGHTNTDTDSVASAVGAAHLFRGTAARSEEAVNGEIAFALEYAGYKDWEEGGKGAEALPPYFPAIPGAADPFNKAVGICLVDCNAPEQMVREVGALAFPAACNVKEPVDAKASQAMRARIRGVIDHHALSEAFATAGPIFLDVRPWGSACSIVAHMFIRKARPIPRPVARLLLCGILSDTVNLTSPTTTEADRMMASLLIFYAEEAHVNQLAQSLFKAKTAFLTALAPFDMVRADQKNFSFSGRRVGFAVLEVNEPEAVLVKAGEIILELRLLKKDKGLDFAFLAVVDLVNSRSDLLICGAAELHLAKAAFQGGVSSALEGLGDMPVWRLQRDCSKDGGHGCDASASSCTDHHHAAAVIHATHGGADLDGDGAIGGFSPLTTKMDLGARISRKHDYIPPIADVLTAGWELPVEVKREMEAEGAPQVETEHLCLPGRGCSLLRRYSVPINGGSSSGGSEGKASSG